MESEGTEPRLPGLQQFSPEQLLFVSYAQVWCEIQTPESLLSQVCHIVTALLRVTYSVTFCVTSQVLSDVHSPGEFRVIGPLGNSEDFQKEFNCPADANMNRPDKCKLW